MTKRILGVFICTSVYTILRYVVFGNVPPSHIPVFLLNKSVSMAAVVFLLYSALHFSKGQKEKSSVWGTISWHCVFIHILLSLIAFSSSYYNKLFESDKMNLIGEITMMFGALATYCFWFLASEKKRSLPVKKIQLLSIFFISGHLIAMGFKGWIAVNKWHGGLPPISLISFLIVGICFVLFIKTPKSLFLNEPQHSDQSNILRQIEDELATQTKKEFL